jgi:hypothetical protein
MHHIPDVETTSKTLIESRIAVINATRGENQDLKRFHTENTCYFVIALHDALQLMQTYHCIRTLLFVGRSAF